MVHPRRGRPVMKAMSILASSYLPTTAKHGISFFEALIMLTKGEPIGMPAAT
jgi:hypothetical protein